MTQRTFWLRLGHGHAQLMLGRYLVAGTAGDLNPQEGRSWLERAAGQGIADAESDLSALGGSAAVEALH